MLNYKTHVLTFFIGTLLSIYSLHTAQAQDLLDSLNDERAENTYAVKATFKDTRIVNLQSNETPGKGVLHFVIAHRFGRINEGFYSLWGLDNATMRMGFDYGITDRLSIGWGRSTHEKTYDGNIKARVIQQSTGGTTNMPISLTWYSSIMCKTKEDVYLTNFSSRLSYVHQIILTRKFSREFSLAIVPSFIHRNLVETTEDEHDQFVLSVGGRYKIGPRVSINCEYNYRINTPKEDIFVNGLSIGFDIDTGGHVFQLHLTNSQGMFERSFLTENQGTWKNGDIFFGFNMSRVFG